MGGIDGGHDTSPSMVHSLRSASVRAVPRHARNGIYTRSHAVAKSTFRSPISFIAREASE